ncbi:MAG: sulfatase-like hydrolase/transferase [Pseudomonadota bacterium]|nr:sulfatase-like hydrolase/transferase [Pseudomonadota bacterium]
MASRDPARPNVLFVLSDDQRAYALGCGGNPEISTPVLDRLAAAGMRFDNFFCTSPVCSPARASLLTGDVPSRHGVHDWVRVGSMPPTRIDYLAGQTLVTDVLAGHSYRCALVGKWHLGASDVPRSSFVEWFGHQSGNGALLRSAHGRARSRVRCVGLHHGRARRSGGIVRAQRGRVSRAVLLVDYLGVRYVPERPKPGRSFRALLEGGSADNGREVVVYDEYGPVRMVRTAAWKYVHRYPAGPHELFDLAADPGERDNRVGDPTHARVVSMLRERLERWFETYVDPRRDGVDKGVTGCGPLARVEDHSPGKPVFADRHLSNADWDLWLEGTQ